MARRLRPEQGATGRRFWVSLALVGLGVIGAIYGVLAPNTYALILGGLLILLFGLVAAGMKRGEAETPLFKVKTDFTAPPPPPQPPEDDAEQPTQPP
jgi:hypothetical protein